MTIGPNPAAPTSPWSVLYRSLIALVTTLSQQRHNNIKPLCRLIVDKFSELQKTHGFFISILETLRHDVHLVHAGIDTRAVDTACILRDFLSALHSAEARRALSREERRAAYEEARVYAEHGFIDRASFILSVPNEPIDRIKAFMQSYCSYFETDDIYYHSLQSAFTSADCAATIIQDILRSNKVIEKKNIRILNNTLQDLLASLNNIIDDTRLRWAAVAHNYHLTIHSFRENGCPFPVDI